MEILISTCLLNDKANCIRGDRGSPIPSYGGKNMHREQKQENREHISPFTCIKHARSLLFTRPTDSSCVLFPPSHHRHHPHSYHSIPDRPNHHQHPSHSDSSAHLLTRLHDSHREFGFVQLHTGSHQRQNCPGNMGSRHFHEDRRAAVEAEGVKRS